MIFEKLKEHLNKPSLGKRYFLHRNSRPNAISSVILTALTAILICFVLNVSVMTSGRYISYVVVNDIQNGQVDPKIHGCDEQCKSKFNERLQSNAAIEDSVKELQNTLNDTKIEQAFEFGLSSYAVHTNELISQIKYEAHLEALKMYHDLKKITGDKASMQLEEARRLYKDNMVKAKESLTQLNVLLWVFPLLPLFLISNIVLANIFFNRKHSKAIKVIEDKYDALKLAEIREYLGKE